MTSATFVAPFVSKSPLGIPVLIPLFGAYLDEASLFCSVRVCKLWCENLQDILSPILKDKHCQRAGYLPELVSAFRTRKLSLWRLPAVDLKDRKGWTDYIDFLKEEEITSPVMRFVDCTKRVGLVIRWRVNVDGSTPHGQEDTPACPIRETSSFFVIFRRRNNQNEWAIASERTLIELIRTYTKIHQQDHQESSYNLCPKCPPFLLQREWVKLAVALITGSDSVIKIDGEIQQV